MILLNEEMDTEKVAYSDEELQEFKELILAKLAEATADYEALSAGANAYGNDISDTNPTYKYLQDSAAHQAREANAQMAERLLKFINGLKAALVRIDNKTYGICRTTGKLIPKARLRAVPHTTQCLEAKLSEKK